MDVFADLFDRVFVGTGQATGTLVAGLDERERIAVLIGRGGNGGGAVRDTCVTAPATASPAS